MIVYSLPSLVVFRQVLWLLRRETILTNKPVLIFFLKYWPLKGLYFPHVCTKAGFQRRGQLISDWILPLTQRWMICNPKEHLPFLGEGPALLNCSCHHTEQVQGPVRLSVNMSSQLLELFSPRASRTHILCIYQHFVSKPKYNPSYTLFIRDSPMPRLGKKQWGIVGVLSLWAMQRIYCFFLHSWHWWVRGKRYPSS